jgi:hypothetical protein
VHQLYEQKLLYEAVIANRHGYFVKLIHASSQQPLALRIQGARNRQIISSNKGSMKPLPLETAHNDSTDTRPKSSNFSSRVLYKKGSNKTSNNGKDFQEPKWRVSVSPDEGDNESIQITMLDSEDGMLIASSTSATSEDNNDNQPVITDAAGGEKRSYSLGNLFKNKKGTNNNSNEQSDKKNGEQNGDESNRQSNGNGDNNSDSNDQDESSNQNNDNNNNCNSKRFDPLTYFGADRVSFAQQSTLPLHNGNESDAPTSHPSWTPAAGHNFHVRVGPNYAKTSKKEPSQNNLYDVYSVRYFRSPSRTISGATRIMPLPEMGGESEGSKETETNGEIAMLNGSDSSHPELKNTKIPDVLVVHFQLPYQPPNMFKQNDDGPGGECVYYLRPSRRFLDEVSGKIAMTPATRLFCRWCHDCQSNVEMRSRFKCMALVRDIERHNFGLLKSYNGKPVLITESGRVCSGFHGDVRYLEMTANGEW